MDTQVKKTRKNLLPAGARDHTTRRILTRLAKDYLRPEWPRIALAIACMLVVSGATAVTAWLLEPAINFIFVGHREDMLILIPFAVFAASTVKAAAGYGQGILMAEVARRLITRIQRQLFSGLMYADLARLQSDHSGTHQAHFLQNTSLLAFSVSSTLVGLFRGVPSALGLIVVMFVMDWQLAIIATLVAPLVALMTRRLSTNASRAMKEVITSTAGLSKRLAEALGSIKIVKAYGREEYEKERSAGLIVERMRHFFRAQRANLAAAPLTEAIAGIGIAGVLYYGGLRVQAGTLELSEFLTFLGAMMWAFQPMRTLSGLATQIAQGVRAAEVLFEELDTAPAIKDSPTAAPLKLSARNGAEVRFENVSFAYGPEISALDGLSLSASPGQTIALVGPSGAGKSTVLSLLLRFFDVGGGRITVDGVDIRDATISSLRDKIAFVAQDPTLFDDTIAANIAYGGDGDIVRAAKLAAADEFITSLPLGYETRAGEGGNQLSGGQKQRIAIARAFIKDAPILLLDEATSALDSHSEARVQQALAQLMRGRTTFVIAHRLSTVHAADRIFVLDRGRVVESGNHDELIAAGGLYAALYRSQFKSDEAKDARLVPEPAGE